RPGQHQCLHRTPVEVRPLDNVSQRRKWSVAPRLQHRRRSFLANAPDVAKSVSNRLAVDSWLIRTQVDVEWQERDATPPRLPFEYPRRVGAERCASQQSTKVFDREMHAQPR